MKKVLIITYYWPPSGGAGVQRWLKFVKYLREYGWEPVVYTPENPEIPAFDISLEKDIPENLTVLKTKIREPYSAYKRFVGRKKDDKIKTGFLSEKKNPSLLEKISVWIRGNLFIPDARKFWIKPSIKYLTNYLKNNPVDALVSTGPPHSMHLIALGLKKKLDIPWLADFRDPWTNIDFYHDLMLSKNADKKHSKLEHEVLSVADSITVISPSMANDFNRLCQRNYSVITNGFDKSDIGQNELELDMKFSISHIGSMVKTRNPEILWQALHEIIIENRNFEKDLEIKLIGQVDYSVDQSMKKFKIDQFVKKTDYLPHDEVVKIQQKSQLLLLLINNTPNSKMVLTGKLFEYLNSGRPILCIGPKDGDAARIIKETKTGIIADFNEKTKIKSEILTFYKDFLSNKIDNKYKGKNIDKYSRKVLTGDLALLLNEITLSKKS